MRNPFQRRVWRAIHELQEKLMSEQEQVNALETAVAQVATDFATAQTTLQTELNELQAKITAGEPVDLSKLTTAVDALDPAVQALNALKPA